MRIGITGHQELADPSAWTWVEDSIDREIAELSPSLIGFSSLAVGADQLFARRVLWFGGQLVVVVPHSRYEDVFRGTERDSYEALLAQASDVVSLLASGSHEDAYLAAGKRIVTSVDRMLAVWNGKPAKGKGGTADAVAYALSLAVPVIHINPELRSVEELRSSSAAESF